MKQQESCYKFRIKDAEFLRDPRHWQSLMMNNLRNDTVGMNECLG
jgi:hypothetical protein